MTQFGLCQKGFSISPGSKQGFNAGPGHPSAPLQLFLGWFQHGLIWAIFYAPSGLSVQNGKALIFHPKMPFPGEKLTSCFLC